MQKQVTIYYLEQFRPENLSMNAPHQGQASQGTMRIERQHPPQPETNRAFYVAVGGDWQWIDRLGWSHQQWLQYLERPELETWILNVNNAPAGYCELEMQSHPRGPRVEIVYFGLLPPFIGQGWGSPFLQRMIARTWEREAQSVWVHTCSLDHPAALNFYRRHGFQDYYMETVEQASPANDQ